ncbi:MAG: hypothetical protein DMD42_04275 [Gemmatimonadetes bacterium]|nr:MAG: hypothetical protein DMD42_04275 [Gemmatimonadota bacterium]
MTFMHKLSRRLAMLKDAWLVVALAALGCEKPVAVAVTDPNATLRLQITPKSITLPTDGATQLMAVALTPAGDTATIDVSWSVTGGSIADTNTHGGRHYAGYKATPDAGRFKVVAHGHGSSATGSDTATITVVPAAVASVKVTPAVVSLLVGAAVQLSATTADSAGNLLAGRSISWSSSDATVASVSTSGLVTSVAQGSASITATSEGQSTAVPVTVTTVPVASLQVSPASANMFVGQTLSLTATPKDAAGNTLTGRPVTWASSSPSVATVSNTGQVAGVTQGSATITATSESKTARATINVAIVPVASVQVSPPTASLTPGQTAQLTATPKDSAGSALTGRAVTWTSSAPTVASVSASGLVTGGTVGSATITAMSEGWTGSATVTVALVPVASVVVTPATATIPVLGTVQLNVTLKDANGTTLTGRAVAWTSSAPTIMTVSATGLVTDVADGGAATVTATSEGKSGTSAVTVQAPLPSGSVPDPTLLPVASGQVPNLVAYLALNVPSQPAGFSYNDPVTGVKVWKVTSSTTPIANPHAGHDYADGPNEVSRGWGPNNNTHTILFYAGTPGVGSPYYLVDFTRGVGFSNYRQLPAAAQPARDLCFSFSSVAGQERIAYVINGNQLERFNTATMQVENTGFFPLTGTFQQWLHQDKNDVWFVGLQDGSTAFAWNSQTNQLLTHAESWLNEARLEHDGRYIALTNTNNTIRLWDLATNTFGPTQSDPINIWLGHNANLRGMWVTTDVNASAPFDLDRYYPSGGQIVKTRFLTNSAGAGVHHAGNWVQSDAELGGNLNRQWSFVGGVDNDAFTATALWKQAIGVMRADGSDSRLLVHHYGTNPTYAEDPFVKPSPDGKVVIFDSNMLGSGRFDVFVAEMPLR